MINDVAEQALLAVLTPIWPDGIPLYVSDEPENKEEVAPSSVLHVSEAVELASPGSGLFKVDCSIISKFHPREDGRDARAEVATLLERWLHSSPASDLSAIDNFHCHGVIPNTSGNLTVDPESKTIIYSTSFQLWCMPRNDS